MPFKDPKAKAEWNRKWWKAHREKQREYRERERAKRRSPLRGVRCELCGDEFQTRRKDKRFCSRTHQRRAQNERYRVKHPDRVRLWRRNGTRRYRAKHSKKLNQLRWKREQKRYANKPEIVHAVRHERQSRYRSSHRESVRVASRNKKRRRDAWLKALTVEQTVELIKRRGEYEWPRTLTDHLLRKLRKQARGDPQ